MPYVKQVRRGVMDQEMRAIEDFVRDTPNIQIGDMNYIVTRLVQAYLRNKTINYDSLNAVVGMLSCAQLELYRRLISEYEDSKAEQNGDVYIWPKEDKPNKPQ
ncbi:MAG: hypothetical protein Q8O88_01050 [bacterium]|nr:hypothetical protein [bacterium]